MMDVQLRRATQQDAAVVAQLGRITFAETFGYLFAEHGADLAAYLDRTFGLAKIEASLGKPMNLWWLATADGLPVAYAKLKYPSPSALLSEPDAAQLQKIYVLRDFMGKGIGVPLLDAALEQAARLGAPVVWLTVLRQNERAIGFYIRHQFTTVGPESYTIGTQTFSFNVMVRPLGSERVSSATM